MTSRPRQQFDLHQEPNGRWKLRWREGTVRRARRFDRKKDALDFIGHVRRRKQLGQAAVTEDVQLAELIETYWQFHAVPNLAASTRDYYKRAWAVHIRPQLGEYGVRELTPKRLKRFRDELERAGVASPTVRKVMAIVQSILSFAVSEEIVEYNAAAAVRKPKPVRTREPHIFLPVDVEQIRANLGLRDRTLVSVLAYSGPRPEEVVCRLTWGDIGDRAVRYVKTKRGAGARFTPLLAPLADDLREWFLASGRPAARHPVFPTNDGQFWDTHDWRNWRRRVWQGQPERKYERYTQRATIGCAPAGTRPRDLRSSFITLQLYAGVPLTTIAKQCGTGVQMIEQHYAGVIENWDGRQVPAEDQIRAARSQHRMITREESS